MSLDEKIAQLAGVGNMNGHYREVTGIPRLGVPALVLTNGPGGVASNDSGPLSPPPATALPAPIGLAATFDPATARQYGQLVGDEAVDTGSNMLEGPVVNLARVPTNGREFEGYGEDPELVSQISVGFVGGVQRPGLIAETKHFAENNQEIDRQYMDAQVDERTLRELELRPFEADANAGVAAVMCAYNAVNGVYSCENHHLLSDVLRDNWGFTGFITSDFGATHSTVPSMLAGLDVEMPSPTHYSGADITAALTAGSITVGEIDQALLYRFTTEIASGLFDHPTSLKPIPFTVDGAAARTVAEQATVLLENQHSLLPLNAAALHHVAVIGPYAGTAKTGGGGSSAVNADYSVSPVVGIQNRVGRAVTVTYDSGQNIATATAAAKSADIAVVVVGDNETEGMDRASLSLSSPDTSYAAEDGVGLLGASPSWINSIYPSQDALIEAVATANPKTIVVVNSGGPVLMPWLSQVSAVLETWYPGEEDGNALSAVLFGDTDPGGRLPVTFPASDAQVPDRTPDQYPGLPCSKWTGAAPGPPDPAAFTPGGVEEIQPPATPAQGPADTNFYGLCATYSEGLFIGYRWYDQQHLDPLFPFGYGLSYTTFRYANLHLSRGGDGAVYANFTVTNTGDRDGTAVPQAYLDSPDSPVGEPLRQVAGFASIDIPAGSTVSEHILLDPISAAYYDTAANGWRLQPGCHTVSVGVSERDIVLTGPTVGPDSDCTQPITLPPNWR